MTDYIKEFGDGQEGKKFIPAKIKRPTEPLLDLRKDLSLNEETITFNEVKELATNLVLELMNADVQPPVNSELLSEQKIEIEHKIREYCNRPGILSLTYHDDFNLNESSIGAMIDPTNKKNWVLLKEEIFYKLPYSYKQSLHEYASQIWEDSRDFFPNLHLKVMKPVNVWIYAGASQPTNAYYGNAQIHEPPSRQFELKPGMEILYTRNGSYVRLNSNADVAYQIALFEPKHPFEKSHGQFKDLWYKNNVEKGNLQIVGEDIPRVKFELVFGKTS